ncbi:MAG: hypothetical protein QOJ69_123, partial [Actinomycetota bacterium]|nr:hypothetical protein [Actinomycetota bacterium]
MAVTVTAVVGLSRLFADGDFLAPVVAAAVASHVLAAACRRMGLHPLLAAAASGIGLVLFVTWVVEPHTATMGVIPGPDTWHAFGTDLRDAFSKFGEVKAPVATTRGFVLACVVGTWMAAWLADLFAFRMRARLEALVPSFTIFLFGAMLGADRHRVAVAALYLSAVLAFVVLADLSAKAASTTWFGHRSADGQGAILRGAVVVAVVAVAVGAAVGPRLPGAASAGLFGLGDNPGGSRSPRITVSPLVDIRGRLVEQSDLEAFVVASPEPAYWRLTSLESFDGSIWSSRGTYQRVKGSLEPDIVSGGAVDPLRQEFTVGALSSIWLPAAFRPSKVTTPVPGMRYERDSASLLTDESTGDGLRYTVESEVPRFSEAELAAAPGGAPPDVAERYLSLPADFPAEAAAAAREATAGQTTAFGKARALQDWFLDNFTYTLNVPPGHGNDAIVRFLRDRKGYCEQFAGAYAAMARSIGLPARVAVGFTPGTLDDAGRYHVSGKQAHAWPEVYLSGFGWVLFEPTPGRTPPGSNYTGTPAGGGNQDGAAPDGSSPATTAPPSPAPSDSPPTPTTAAPDPSPQEPPQGSASDGLGAPLAILLAVVLAGLAVAAVPLARRVRRDRRRSAASTPAERVLVAWDEVEEDLGVTGLGRLRHETTTEYAGRVGPVAGAQVASPLGWLAAGT